MTGERSDVERVATRLEEIASRGLYVDFGSPDHDVFKRAAAIIKAIPQAGDAPDYVLVPREPTEAMLAAAGYGDATEEGRDYIRMRYRLMIAAAPRVTWNEKMSLKDKVHRVEELEGELSMLKADYADCNRERIRWMTIATSQLNAAAPDLLSALQEAVCIMTGAGSWHQTRFQSELNEAIDHARAAIAKAQP